jgi:hypothetical protein
MNGDSGWDRESRYEEAELSFDFEAEDTYAAGDKVLEIAKHLGECRGVLDWKILSIVQIKDLNALPPFCCDGAEAPGSARLRS